MPIGTASTSIKCGWAERGVRSKIVGKKKHAQKQIITGEGRGFTESMPDTYKIGRHKVYTASVSSKGHWEDMKASQTLCELYC